MKVLTVVGTRPEVIRLSRIIPQLDKACEHILVHTMQNIGPALNGNIFRDLQVRKPDIELMPDMIPTYEWIQRLHMQMKDVLDQVDPDRVLILGDTYSGLSAETARNYGIPVCHLEAGNRCYNSLSPEEDNRRRIDELSSILMPYTFGSQRRLLYEDFHPKKIFVVGNPIYEVMNYYSTMWRQSKVDIKQPYILVTLHRAENVDNPEILRGLLQALKMIAAQYTTHTIVVSVHPRTASKITDDVMRPIKLIPNIMMRSPFDVFDFMHLEAEADLVITDSGTVQEECCIMGTSCVIARTSTERPETIECGNAMLAGTNPFRIAECVAHMIGHKSKMCPSEYTKPDVSRTVTNIVLGEIP